MDHLLKTVTNTNFLAALGIISTAVIWVLIIVMTPRIVRRLPADYFSNPEYLKRKEDTSRPLITRIAIHAAKNLAGVILILLGTVGLQGVLVVMLGLWLMDIPRKNEAIRRLATIGFVWRQLQRMRASGGVPPLLKPNGAP